MVKMGQTSHPTIARKRATATAETETGTEIATAKTRTKIPKIKNRPSERTNPRKKISPVPKVPVLVPVPVPVSVLLPSSTNRQRRNLQHSKYRQYNKSNTSSQQMNSSAISSYASKWTLRGIYPQPSYSTFLPFSCSVFPIMICWKL